MKNPISINFLLFIGFLMVGYSVSTKFYSPKYGDYSGEPGRPSSHGDAIQSLGNGQRMILLIGVKSLAEAQAQLESVWLISYLPPDSTLYFFPLINLGDEIKQEFESQIEHSFWLEKKNGLLMLSPDFIEILKEHNYWWSGYIIIDQAGVANITNILQNTEGDGNALLEYPTTIAMTETKNYPINNLSQDISLIQTTCHSIASYSKNLDLLNSLFEDRNHLITDLDRNEITLEAYVLFSNGHIPNCRFLTLDNSSNGS
jgi:hypothetical protein